MPQTTIAGGGTGKVRFCTPTVMKVSVSSISYTNPGPISFRILNISCFETLGEDLESDALISKTRAPGVWQRKQPLDTRNDEPCISQLYYCT